MTTIPQELADARRNVAEAWNEYQVVIDNPHTPDEFTAALNKAMEAEKIASQWYRRWQDVGGTSDITSIVESENVWMESNLTVKAAWMETESRVRDIEYALNNEPITKERAIELLDELGEITTAQIKDGVSSPEWFAAQPEAKL